MTLHSGDMYYKSHGASFSMQISAGDGTINGNVTRPPFSDHRFPLLQIISIDSPLANAPRSLYLNYHLLPLSYLSSLVPSYLHLREVGGDHAITSVYVPPYTRAKVITIDNSLLEEEAVLRHLGHVQLPGGHGHRHLVGLLRHLHASVPAPAGGHRGAGGAG